MRAPPVPITPACCALHEAGVKVDLVAGRGIGALAAVFAAIDGGQKLWGENAFWDSDAVKPLYDWRPSLKLAVWALALSLGIVVAPLLAVAVGAIVFPFDFVVRMLGLGGASGLIGVYTRLADRLFAPTALPTLLPRLVVIVLGMAALTIAIETFLSHRPPPRTRRPLVARPAGAVVVERSARTHRGRRCGISCRAARGSNSRRRRISQADTWILLSENLGQPGFRELVIAAHDLDARRDLVFALVEESRRRVLIRRASTADADVRRAEVVDLSGAGRTHLADAVAAALSVAVVNDAHPMTFAPDSCWRGETHRLCDRPGVLSRLLDELTELGVEQVIVVSAASALDGPHALNAGTPGRQGTRR